MGFIPSDDDDEIAASILDGSYFAAPKQPNGDVSDLLERMRGGVFSQESGGNYKVKPNGRTGATGGFQVLPENIPSWTRKYLGKSLTREQFEADPQAQETVFAGEMGKYLQKARAKAPDDDTALRMGAAAWYGGEGAMDRYDDPKRFRPNEPSFREYTMGVLNKSGEGFNADKIAQSFLDDGEFDADAIASEFLGSIDVQPPIRSSEKPLVPPTDVGKAPVPTMPAQMPSNLGSMAQATPPMPESPDTLEYQRRAAHDPNSTRAAVLYTPGAPVPPVVKGETDIRLNDGSVLRANINKFNQFIQANGPTAYNDLKSGNLDFTSLIGGKAQPTSDTAGKAAVVTRDPQGRELVASSVENLNDDVVAMEAAMQKAQFPNQPTETRVETSEEVIAGRLGQPLATERGGASSAMVSDDLRSQLGLSQAQPSGSVSVEVGPMTPVQGQSVGQNPVVRENRTVQQATNEKSSVVQNESDDSVYTLDLSKKRGGYYAEEQSRQVAENLARELGVPVETALNVVKQFPLKYADGNGSDVTEEFLEAQAKAGMSNRVTIGKNVKEQVKAAAAKEVERKRELEERTAQFQSELKPDEPGSLAPIRAAFEMGLMSHDDFLKKVKDERDIAERLKTEVANYATTATAIPGIDDPAKVGEKRKVAEKEYIDAILKDYGTLSDYKVEQDRLKEEYKYRPLAHPIEFAKNFGGAVPKAVASMLKSADIALSMNPLALGKKMADGRDPAAIDETALSAIGDGINRYLEENKNKDLKKNLFVTVLPDTLGQVATQIAAGVLSGGATVPTLLGASMGAAAQYDEAKKFNASDKDKLIASTIGALAAVPDALLFRGWFSKASGAEKTGFLSNLTRSIAARFGVKYGEKTGQEVAEAAVSKFIKSSFGEGVQEVSENKINDWVALQTYDKSDARRKKLNSVTDEDMVSFLGGLIGGAGGAAVQIASEKGEYTPNVDSYIPAEQTSETPAKSVTKTPPVLSEASNDVVEKPQTIDTKAADVDAVDIPTKPLTAKDKIEPGTPVTIEGRGEAVIVEDKGKNVVVDVEPTTGKDGETVYKGRATVRKEKITPKPNENTPEVQPQSALLETVQDQAPDVPNVPAQITDKTASAKTPTEKPALPTNEVAPVSRPPLTVQSIQLKDKGGSSVEDIPIIAKEGKFSGSLEIPRAEMPQIAGDDVKEFNSFAKERGVEIKSEQVKAGILKPTQRAYNPEHAAALPDEALDKPLTVSSDNRVLDGHNRLVRLLEDGERSVTINRVPLPAKEALALMKEFPKTTYKNLNQVGAMPDKVLGKSEDVAIAEKPSSNEGEKEATPTREGFIGDFVAGEEDADGNDVIGNFKTKKEAQETSREVKGHVVPYLNGKYKTGWTVVKPKERDALKGVKWTEKAVKYNLAAHGDRSTDQTEWTADIFGKEASIVYLPEKNKYRLNVYPRVQNAQFDTLEEAKQYINKAANDPQHRYLDLPTAKQMDEIRANRPVPQKTNEVRGIEKNIQSTPNETALTIDQYREARNKVKGDPKASSDLYNQALALSESDPNWLPYPQKSLKIGDKFIDDERGEPLYIVQVDKKRGGAVFASTPGGQPVKDSALLHINEKLRRADASTPDVPSKSAPFSFLKKAGEYSNGIFFVDRAKTGEELKAVRKQLFDTETSNKPVEMEIYRAAQKALNDRIQAFEDAGSNDPADIIDAQGIREAMTRPDVADGIAKVTAAAEAAAGGPTKGSKKDVRPIEAVRSDLEDDLMELRGWTREQAKDYGKAQMGEQGTREMQAEIRSQLEEKRQKPATPATPATPQVKKSATELFREKLEKLKAEQAKPQDDDDDGFSDLDAAMGFEPPAKSGVKTEYPFYQSKWDTLKPIFEKIVSKFDVKTEDARMEMLLRKLNERYDLDQIAQLEPYVVKFIEENVLQSAENESIKEVEDDTRTADQGTRGEAQDDAGIIRNAADMEGRQPDDARTSGKQESTSAPAKQPRPTTGERSKPESGPELLQPVGERDIDDGGIAIGSTPSNFVITDEIDFEHFSPKLRFKDNLRALQTLNYLEEENRLANEDEQKTLARYVGWGGLKQVFDENNEQWAGQRRELKETVSAEEYDRARRSVLDAHYTSKDVVKGIWRALQRFGFEKGSILEPSMGTGNFIGLIPAEMQNQNQITGVELDPLTSRIAQHLYPHAEIHAGKGFQDVYIAPKSIDVAVGNPPFGDQKVLDKNSPELSKFRIHAYFFAKTIDSLRPGGVMGMVVSKGFMDSRAPEAIAARNYIAKKAALVGAIRLPNTAFKGNANTEVVTDIVFFRKFTNSNRPTLVRMPEHDWEEIAYLQDKKTGEPIPVNRYFADNPDMMLGEMTLAGSMYRANEPTLEPIEGQDLAMEMAKAIDKLPADIYSAGNKGIEERLTNASGKDLADYDGLRAFNYGINEKGEPYQLLLDLNKKAYEVPVKAAGRELERMVGMIEIRQTVRELLAKEADPAMSDAALMPIRERLNKQYDAFIKKNGFVSSDVNKRVFREDADYPLLMAIERDYDRGVSRDVAKKEGVDPRQPSAGKADIFTKRTVTPTKVVTSVASAQDAMLASMNDRGRVDLPFMFELLKPESMDAMIRELGDLIYRDPVGSAWVTRDAYLSGDVKTKLEKAQAAAQEDAQYERNVAALEEVQPADVAAPDIFVKIGSPWVPTEVYQSFVAHLIEGNMSGQYNSALGKFLNLSISSGNTTLNVNKWGVPNKKDGSAKPLMTAAKILEMLFENKQPTIKTPKLDSDGRPVTNQDGDVVMTVDEDGTAAALGKAEEMQDEFVDWLWRDQEQRQTLVRLFNDRFNRRVQQKFDGSYLTFPGKNPNIHLRAHQSNFVSRAVQKGVVLADHVVGAGKTFASIAAAIEMRRLGLAKKPLFTVPNHLVEQWARDFKLLYPGAKVLAASKKDFTKQNRRQFFAKIATGDWDAVVVAHSSYGFIPVPKEVERNFLNEQVQELNAAIDEMKRDKGQKGRSVRDMEKARERLQIKLAKLNDRKRDDLLNYAEMGIDALFVDEAHKFKNLFFTTQKQGVGSLGDPSGSQRAFDMFMKVRMTMDKNNGRNVFFLTGTPVSNSLAEIFHMQRYLQYEQLKTQGLHTFDAWANTFGQDTMDWELNAAGKFRQKLRFLKFANLPELRQLYREIADSVTNEDIKKAAEAEGKPFPIPQVDRIKVIVPRTSDQAAYMGIEQPKIDANGDQVFDEDGLPVMADYKKGTIIYRLENWKRISTDENSSEYDPKENVLRITGDARKAGLDMRSVNEGRGASGKIPAAAKNIYDVWQENDYRKGTQLVFCDLSIPNQHRGVKRAGAGQMFFFRDEGRVTLRKGTPIKSDALPDRTLFSFSEGRSFTIVDDLTGMRLITAEGKTEALGLLSVSVQQKGLDNVLEMLAEKEIDEVTREEILADWKIYQDSLNLDDDSKEEDAGDGTSSTGVLETSKFSAYEEIRKLLVEKGIPKDQVAFIHDYNTDLQKAKLFGMVNRGDIRVLIGSTEKMGAGTNVQKKLVAIHHIDVPWKPSDLEQRNGRGIRQGNDFYTPDFKMKIFDYATEKMYDARMWEIVEQKGTSIDKFRLSDDVREIEDVSPESANAAEMKASATGDPRILESIQLKAAIKKLEAQKKTFDRSKYDIQDTIRKFESKETVPHQRIEVLDEGLAIAAKNPVTDDLQIHFGEKAYPVEKIYKDGNKEAAQKFLDHTFARVRTLEIEPELGKFRGFSLILRPVRSYSGQGTVNLLLKMPDGKVVGDSVFSADDSPSLEGVMQRIRNMVDKIADRKQDFVKALDRLKREYETAKTQKEANFPRLAELDEMKERHKSLIQELRAKRSPSSKSALSRKLDDADILESERLTVEEMKDLSYAPFDDLIDGRAKVDVVNGNISANAASHEIYRRALEYNRVKAGRTRIGAKHYEDLFTGVFMRPNEVRDIIAGLTEKRDEAKDLGYSADEVAVFDDHIKALQDSAEAGQGTAVIYILDRALPHELFHRADYMGAMDKALMQRHSKGSAKALDEHRVTSILAAKHFAKFNQYSQLSDSMRRAWIRSEIPPLLLELTDQQLADYGITPEMSADYLLKWFEGYVEKNGIDSLDNFDKEEINVQEFLKQVKAEYAVNQDGKSGKENEGNTRPQEKPKPEARGNQSGGQTGSERSVDDTQKLRSLPATMRAAGLDAVDMAYEVFRDKAATDEATRLLNEYGVEGAIKLLRDLPAQSQDAQHAILSFMLIRTLQDHANEIRATDPATAQKHYELSLNLAREHAIKATQAGRFTRIPSVIGPTLEHLTYAIQGIIEDKYGEGKTLSDAEREKWESLGRQLEEAHAQITGLQKERRNQAAVIKRLKDEKEGKKRKRRSSSAQKSRAKLVQLVKDEKQTAVDAIRARLRERFNSEPSQMSAVAKDFEPWTENGKVVTVYHGSPNGKVELKDRDRGIWLTSSKDLAEGYTYTHWLRGGREPNIQEFHVSFENPLVIDALGKRNDNIPVPWSEWKPKVFGNLPDTAVSVEDAYKYAIASGHDGLIVKNVVDTQDVTDKTKGDVYAVKSVRQLSAIDDNDLGTLKSALPSKQYEERMVVIAELIKRDPDLREYLQKANPKPGRRVREPIVIGIKDGGGIVVDGMKRIAQAISNGQKTIKALVEANEPRLRSAVAPDESFPIDDFAEVGAMMLTDGLAGTEDYLPHHFEADMVAEFGDAVKPYFTEIYKRSWAKRTEWLNEIRAAQTKERIENKYNEGNELEDWEVEEILGEQKAKAKRRRAIEAYHRMAAGGKTHNRNLADLKRIIAEIAPDTDTAIGAILHAERIGPNEIYSRMNELGITDEKDQREALRNGKKILDQARVELQNEQDETANELLDAEAELKRISDLRWEARNEMNRVQRNVADEMRRIKSSEFWYRTGQVVDITNSMRTMMASFDMSGALRQGGFFAFARPELQRQAFVNMFKSIGEKGYGRAIMDLEEMPLFTLAQRAGIDFAMAGKGDDTSLMGEELFRGEQTIEMIPVLGKILAEAVVKPSERTYTAFLDTQRMTVFNSLARELMSQGMTFEKNRPQFEQIARFINVATGRGTMPSSKFAKLILDLPLFAPRYTLSRMQLLNMTLNPVAYYHMPAGTRAIVAKNAARFYGSTMSVLGLVAMFGAAIGASVNWDDDDDDFLKITVGNTKYDIFAGTLPVAKLLIKLMHSAYRNKMGFENRLPNEFGADAWNALLRFGRGKLSPVASLGVDVVSGSDYIGNKTELTTKAGGVTVPGKAIYSRLIPLTIGDAIEAYKIDGGTTGIAKSTPFSWFGVGVSTYKPRPERPETEAEKLAAKAAGWNFTGASRLEKEQRDLKNDLVARSRRGEDITAEFDKAVASGVFTKRQLNDITGAAKKTFLEDKAEGLPIEQVEQIYKVATPAESNILLPMLQKKLHNIQRPLVPAFLERLAKLGVTKASPKAKPRKLADLVYGKNNITSDSERLETVEAPPMRSAGAASPQKRAEIQAQAERDIKTLDAMWAAVDGSDMEFEQAARKAQVILTRLRRLPFNELTKRQQEIIISIPKTPDMTPWKGQRQSENIIDLRGQ